MIASGTQRPLWAPSDPNGKTWSQIINTHPLIIHGWRSTGFPVGSASVIGPLIRDRPVTFLIMSSFPVDHWWHRNQLVAAARAFHTDLPQHDLIFLCNTDRETEGLLAADLQAITINQNCLFDEEIYTPVPEILPEFDAVYVARLSPLKRHHLAAAIKSLVLIYHYDSTEHTPSEFHAAHARYKSLLPSAYFANDLTPDGCRYMPPHEVNRILARSRVGLCLSEIEAAMRASIEYLSAGLPVVSTRSPGGRERFFDDEFCLTVEDNPQQIREAVDALVARRIPRQYIREKTLLKVSKERTQYINLVQNLIERGGGQVRFAEHFETLLRESGILCWRSMSEFSETVLRSIQPLEPSLAAMPTIDECFARGAIAMPRVSLIVTNYNYSRFLGNCLSSIKSQTYGNIECIIVDDASIDDSDAAIQEFVASNAGNCRFQYVRNAQRVGQLACFKIGLARASGDFIAFVDSDDLLFSDFVEIHVRHHLRADTVYGLSCSDLIQIGANDQVLAGTVFPRSALDDIVRSHNAGNARDFDFSQAGRVIVRQNGGQVIYLSDPIEIGNWRWSMTSAMLFRRSVTDMIMPADGADLKICADAYLCYLAHAIGRSIIIRSAHGCYRRHGGNNFASNPVLSENVPLSPVHKATPFDTIQKLALRHAGLNRDCWTEALGPDQFDRIVRELGSGQFISSSEALQQKITSQDRLIREIFGSTSWRVTRPLRIAGTLVKAMLRRMKRRRPHPI